MVVVVNRFDKEESITMDWMEEALIPSGSYQLENIWTGTQLGRVVVGGDHFQDRQTG